MVDDADDDGPGLRRGKVRRVAGRVPSGTQDVEFRERLSRTRREEDVSEGAGCDRNAEREGDREGLVEERIVVPVSEGKDEGRGGPVCFGQSHSPPPRREADEDREHGNCRNDRSEPDSPRGEVQEQTKERYDRDAQAEAEGDPLDPVEFLVAREQGRDKDVAWHEQDEEDCEDVANVAQEQSTPHDERVADRDQEIPRSLLKMNPHRDPSRWGTFPPDISVSSERRRRFHSSGFVQLKRDSGSKFARDADSITASENHEGRVPPPAEVA